MLAVAFVAVCGGAALTTATLHGSSASDAAQTQISSCTTIDEPGEYVLASDIENGGKTPISKSCIRITADGVTLDGDGHLVDGRGVSDTKGIAAVDTENVVIRNVEVDDWHAGVLVEGGSATVRDVRTYSNAFGVRLENATSATVEDSAVEENLVGVFAINQSVTLTGNEFSGNEIEVQRD